MDLRSLLLAGVPLTLLVGWAEPSYAGPTHDTTEDVLQHGVPTGTSFRTEGNRTEELRNGVPTGNSWVRNGDTIQHLRHGVPSGTSYPLSR